MIRKFLAILIISCLVSCVAMTPIPVAGDLEMDFPIEDPDNLSEGTIERHSIEMSGGASMDIDESFTTGLTFGIRGSRYYEAQFSDSNEIWFSENKRDGNTLNMTGRINHNLRYYLNGWEYNSPFAEIRSNIVEGPFAGGSDNLKTKVGFNITNIKLGYEWNMQDLKRFEILDEEMTFTKVGWIYHFNGIDDNIRNYIMEKTARTIL